MLSPHMGRLVPSAQHRPSSSSPYRTQTAENFIGLAQAPPGKGYKASR